MAAQTPKSAPAPKAPQAPRAERAPRAPQAPKAPQAERAPRAPQAPRAPKAERAPRAPQAPRAPKSEPAPRSAPSPIAATSGSTTSSPSVESSTSSSTSSSASSSTSSSTDSTTTDDSVADHDLVNQTPKPVETTPKPTTPKPTTPNSTTTTPKATTAKPTAAPKAKRPEAVVISGGRGRGVVGAVPNLQLASSSTDSTSSTPKKQQKKNSTATQPSTKAPTTSKTSSKGGAKNTTIPPTKPPTRLPTRSQTTATRGKFVKTPKTSSIVIPHLEPKEFITPHFVERTATKANPTEKYPPELVADVASILGVDVEAYPASWSIMDKHNELVLAHFNEKNTLLDIAKYGHIRGTLIDLETRTVLDPSFGYTPVAVVNELQVQNDNYTVVDTKGYQYQYPVAETEVKRLFEGVVFRVIWYKGQSYHISHRKVVPMRSRWGSSPTFLSMYTEAGGPTDDQLFNTSKPYSTTCYNFLIVHPSLLVGTRQDVKVPYVVHLMNFEMDLSSRPSSDIAVGTPTYKSFDKISGIVANSFIHAPNPLSLAAANRHLESGYFQPVENTDYRLKNGEGLIMYRVKDGQMIPSSLIKIHSSSFDWRVKMRGDDPNIAHQFYNLLDTAYPDVVLNKYSSNSSEDKCIDAWDQFQQKYMLLPKDGDRVLRELYELHNGVRTLPPHSQVLTREDFASKDDRIKLMWMNYLISIPPCVQQQALDVYNNFVIEREELVRWVCEINSRYPDLQHAVLQYAPYRLKKLIQDTRSIVQAEIKKGRSNYTFEATVRSLLHREVGTSLYMLIREMKRSQRPPTVVAASSEPEQCGQLALAVLDE